MLVKFTVSQHLIGDFFNAEGQEMMHWGEPAGIVWSVDRVTRVVVADVTHPELLKLIQSDFKNVDLSYKPPFGGEQLAYLKDLFTPRCCHTTGMHDPRHFVDKQYVCNDQKAEAFDRGRELLGFGEVTPEDAIPADDCGRCQDYGLQ